MISLMRWIKSQARNQNYDSVGNVLFLEGREHLDLSEIAPSYSQELVTAVMKIICECFDISEAQIGQLRTSDRIWTIYEQIRVSEWHDDLELERFTIALEQKIDGFSITDDFLQKVTIGDVMKLIDQRDT